MLYLLYIVLIHFKKLYGSFMMVYIVLVSFYLQLGLAIVKCLKTHFNLDSYPFYIALGRFFYFYLLSYFCCLYVIFPLLGSLTKDLSLNFRRSKPLQIWDKEGQKLLLCHCDGLQVVKCNSLFLNYLFAEKVHPVVLSLPQLSMAI